MVKYLHSWDMRQDHGPICTSLCSLFRANTRAESSTDPSREVSREPGQPSFPLGSSAKSNGRRPKEEREAITSRQKALGCTSLPGQAAAFQLWREHQGTAGLWFSLSTTAQLLQPNGSDDKVPIRPSLLTHEQTGSIFRLWFNLEDWVCPRSLRSYSFPVHDCPSAPPFQPC